MHRVPRTLPDDMQAAIAAYRGNITQHAPGIARAPATPAGYDRAPAVTMRDVAHINARYAAKQSKA